MLLALETANDWCSVSLYDGQQVVAHRQDERSREQTRLILPMIDAVLEEQQLTLATLKAIAFSRGPGSFSGVRINAAVTQALAWANDLPVIAVSTLQAVAQAAYRLHQCEQVVVVLDARMGEVYSAAYQLDANGLMQAVSTELLMAYAEFELPIVDNFQPVLVGSGSTLVKSDSQLIRHTQVQATSMDVAVLGDAALQAGQTVTAHDALPVYLRENAWKKIAEQSS